ATIVTGPAHGVLNANADGSFSYTPDANYSGSDSFTYSVSDGEFSSNVATISLIITPVNDAPVAANLQATTLEDKAVAITPQGSDMDSSALTAAIVSGPQRGALVANAGGSFTYTPQANYFGSDSFTYRFSDGLLNSNLATVSITIVGVNDAPLAKYASFAMHRNVSLVIDPRLLVSDVDGDNLTITLSKPRYGALANNGNGTYTYTPFSGFIGTDILSYSVTDGKLFAYSRILIQVIDQVSPIVLDMNGDGIHTLALGETTGTFDLLNNGMPVESGWLSAGDAFLAVDADHNGRIDCRAEMFGGEIGQGFALLATYDSNGDGAVDKNDERFGELLLWQDGDSNHRTDGGELKSLAEAGIVSLNPNYEVRPVMQNGNTLIEHSVATVGHGQVISMVDAYFSIAPSAGAALPAQDGKKPAILPSSWREALEGDRTESIIVHSAEATGVQRPTEPVAGALLPGFAWSHNPIAFRHDAPTVPVVDWSATGRGLPPPDDEPQGPGDHWLTDFLGATTGRKDNLAKLTGLKFKMDAGQITKPH
ncbi:MAG: repeat-containing protein, partial [Gallionellaceae bacterium]